MLKSALLAGALTLAATTAHAIEIDFGVKLLDLDGNAYRDCVKWDRSDPTNPSCADWLEHTLGLVAFSALDRPEPGLGVLDQARRGALARKVYKAGTVDLTTKEVDLVIEQLGKLQLRPAELRRAVELLDATRLK